MLTSFEFLALDFILLQVLPANLIGEVIFDLSLNAIRTSLSRSSRSLAMMTALISEYLSAFFNKYTPSLPRSYKIAPIPNQKKIVPRIVQNKTCRSKDHLLSIAAQDHNSHSRCDTSVSSR